MVHGTVRSLFQLLGALATTALVLAVWVVVRLSQGPLSLAFLTPYIEAAMSQPGGGGLSVRLDDTVLMWDEHTRSLEIRTENVRALSADAVIASVPEMSVSLSGRLLLHGVVAPRSLRLYRPRLRLHRDAQGGIQFGMGETTAGDQGDSSMAAEGAFDALLAPPDADSATGQLRRVEVVGADLTVEDEGLRGQWHVPHADITFLRDTQGISGSARLSVELGGELSRIEADGHYRLADRLVDASVSYGGLRPALFAALAPQLKPLEAARLPTGGTVGVRYSLDRGLTGFSFDLAGGQGVIDATAWAGMSVAVSSVALKGALSDDLNRLVLDEARIDLGGPLLNLSGQVTDLRGATQLDLSARIEDMPVDALKNYWPAQMAPNPRQWVLGNLSRGNVGLATAHLVGHAPPGKTIDALQVDKLEGEVNAQGVTVRYLPPMPLIDNVTAKCHFDQNDFVIDADQGQVMGLKVQAGHIILGGLSAAIQTADIGLKIDGPVSDALRLIDSKPLGWAQRLGINPAVVKGNAVTDLDLKFPLLAKLSFDQMKVHAHAQTTGIGLPGVAMGMDLSDGDLALDVDPKGLDVTGKAKLGGLPADLRWRENFTRGAPFRSRYIVQTSLDDAGRRLVGLDVAPFQPPFMSGPVPLDIIATLFEDGRGDIDIKGNLFQAAMTLPGLNWNKPAATPGQASAQVRLDGGHLSEVSAFAVTAADGGLDVAGRVAFEDGKPRRVVFQRAKWGRTDISGSLTLKGAEGLALDIGGAEFDAREMIAGAPTGQPKPPRDPNPKPREEVVPLSIQAHLGKIWVSDGSKLAEVRATMARDNHDWRQMQLDARVGNDQPMHLEIHPAGPNRRSLKLTSSDAGAVFRTFDVFENVVGGQLLVDAAFDDADPRQPLSGQATVSDYHVVKAPALARLLTVAALTGILDVLSDQGISFSTLEAPFALTDGVLDLRDARAAGSALGITAKGQIDLDSDVLALEGTVVPAYALNSALGNLPVVGRLFAAEKGGGLVAMNYSMKGPASDPSVMVNPLSALTPGMLRKLFNIFDDGRETEVRTDKAEIPAAPPEDSR